MELFKLIQENLIDKKWTIQTKFGKRLTQITDTGQLLKTMNFRIENGKFIIEIPQPYASDIEFGRPKGKAPPFKPILRWVRRKLGIRSMKKAKQVAWAIVNKIKEEGTQPRPFVRLAIKSLEDELKE